MRKNFGGSKGIVKSKNPIETIKKFKGNQDFQIFMAESL